MATVATRRRTNVVSQIERRILLTPTGLLMEGDFTQNPSMGDNSRSTKSGSAAYFPATNKRLSFWLYTLPSPPIDRGV